METATPPGLGPSLHVRLSKAIPSKVKLVYHHISTPPTRCESLFAPPPGRKPQRTYRESHTFAISSHSAIASNAEPFIFAIEVFIYTTKSHSILFVSKADSTGCQIQAPRAKGASPLSIAASVFVDWLVDERRRPNVPFVVSLFARAQNQYLFPGSESNEGKHILNDRQLVRWWCKTLDPVARKTMSIESSAAVTMLKQRKSRQAYLIVPGFDRHETTQFFPETWRADPAELRVWVYGHPLCDISPYPAAAPRSMVPRFPDDPKTRYLDDLDAEIPNAPSFDHKSSPAKRSDQWSNVKSLDMFWEMMAFRQECRSGRLVGFLWIVIQPNNSAVAFDDAEDGGSKSPSCLLTASLSSNRSPPKSSHHSSSNKKPSKRRHPLTGPIIPRRPRIKTSETSNATAMPEWSPYYRWPPASRGQVVLTQADYDRLHEILIKLDFTNCDAAKDSTSKWLAEVSSISGRQREWGTLVVGEANASSRDHVDAAASKSTADQVTDLSSSMLVRKKRKIEDQGQDARAEPQVLGAGLVRKRPKAG